MPMYNSKSSSVLRDKIALFLFQKKKKTILVLFFRIWFFLVYFLSPFNPNLIFPHCFLTTRRYPTAPHLLTQATLCQIASLSRASPFHEPHSTPTNTPHSSIAPKQTRAPQQPFTPACERISSTWWMLIWDSLHLLHLACECYFDDAQHF